MTRTDDSQRAVAAQRISSCIESAMFISPFKSQRSVHLLTQHPRPPKRFQTPRTHRGRPDFTDPRFLRDGTDLIDKSIGISKFFPARLEDRALRRRLELVRPRQAHHRFDPDGRLGLWQDGVRRSSPVWRGVFLFSLSRPFTVRVGRSESTSTRIERRQFTHTHMPDTHTHNHAQWKDCSKAASTSARKTRHRAIQGAEKPRFAHCLRSNLLLRNKYFTLRVTIQ